MTMGANTVPQISPPWSVLVVLLLVLALSVAMFVALVRRWTDRRTWVALSDWARARRFRASIDDGAAPPPLDALKEAPLVAHVCVSDGTSSLMRLGRPAAADAPGDLTAAPAAAPQWHVLVRRIDAPWQPTGLRPAAAASSLLDLFSLTSFPLMGETQRFVVFGTDSAPARKLSKSHARALLPPDIGLLLHGHHLVLDFSERPFDTIELDRMLALAEQLVANLPVPAGR